MGGSRSRPVQAFVGSSAELASSIQYLVVEGGLRLPVIARRRELLTLATTVRLADGVDDLQLAQGFKRYTEFCVELLPDGDAREALAELLATSPSSYGRTTAIRRGRAARAMDVKVDTFRRNYEKPLVEDLAATMWLIEIESRLGPEGDSSPL